MSEKVKFELSGKDTNLPQELIDQDWFEFGEYFRAVVEVDPKTGKGTIKFTKLGCPTK